MNECILDLTACNLEMTKSCRSESLKIILVRLEGQQKSESQNGKGKKGNRENETVEQET